MSSATQHTNTADYYFGLLENLNSNSKLELISRLSLSIKKEEDSPETTLQSLFGAYKSDETAEEILEGLRHSRVFNRNTEPL